MREEQIERVAADVRAQSKNLSVSWCPAASTGHATAAALKTLTGTHLLPFAGKEGPCLDDIPGNRAVVIKATAPAQLDGGVTDVSHHHTPGGAWRSWDDERQTDTLLR